jgi:hypothetical protein
MIRDHTTKKPTYASEAPTTPKTLRSENNKQKYTAVAIRLANRDWRAKPIASSEGVRVKLQRKTTIASM